ncbi:MAG TPA: hemerythrin domain-containing protein [Acidimicrobiales bacterium]|nr:hemerythrin domain-containing protein [Acidimicrobiales bacterium]
MPDVLAHLMEEHRKVERMLAQLKDSDPGDQRDELFRDLTDSLRTHMAVEERFLYPLMAEHLDEETAADATDEHELARSGISEAAQRLEEGAFSAAIEILEAGIGHHVEEEESELFPKLRERAAGQLAQMEPDDLEAQVAGDDQTRDELYEKAQEADVPGRSTMTKQELQEAVAEQ